GYARDFVSDIGELLPEIVSRGIRVIASAGGVNPHGCARALAEVAKAKGISDLRIGVVSGDDVLPRMRGERTPRLALQPLDPRDLPYEEVLPRITSAHAYLGAEPIARALDQGAQVVITGRVTDTALVLAPMMFELGIHEDDWDALAMGTVVGHLLECGAQASGGNHLGDWRSVPSQEAIGYPIAEIESADSAVITKHESLGGLVTVPVLKEQLIYEIGDPRSYFSADVIADFTTIELAEIGENRVRLSGVRGRPRPETLKVSCVYDAGFKVSGELTYPWPEAAEKARAAGALVRARAERLLGAVFDEWRIEVIGAGALHGDVAPPAVDPPEVVLRVSARSKDRAACDHVGREIIGVILTGPPGATGYAGPRPRASALRSIWSGLVPRVEIEPRVEVVTP
ncbi:MAG TPA: acyclic terpene utilization AtuA family protein, partial [Planctomycetota bacterium]|nr:acyclic terpene utilization AtuA family protein [Planctomycetota bacterium]